MLSSEHPFQVRKTLANNKKLNTYCFNSLDHIQQFKRVIGLIIHWSEKLSDRQICLFIETKCKHYLALIAL